MAKRIIYGTGKSEVLFAELEELRIKRDLDGIIARALRSDSNILVLNEVLNCVKEGPISPTAHADLLKAVLPSLDRRVTIPKRNSQSRQSEARKSELTRVFAPPSTEERPTTTEDEEPESVGIMLDRSRNLFPFVAVKDALPGNGMAESSCSSHDGAIFAYLTSAAVGIQDSGATRMAHHIEVPLGKDGDLPPRGSLPRLINVVNFAPYEAWSLPLADLTAESGSDYFRLAGVDHSNLFLLHSHGGDDWLREIDVRDGRTIRAHMLGKRCEISCLDLSGRRHLWIDPGTSTLESLELGDGSKRSFPLDLPPGLRPEDLRFMEFGPDGMGVILVDPRAEVSGVLLGLIRLPIPNSDPDTPLEVRWLKRRDLLLEKGFEKAALIRQERCPGRAADSEAFYLVDSSNTIRKLALAPLRGHSLEALVPTDLLTDLEDGSGGGKALFPILAVGAERPLLAVYDQTTASVRLWDASTDTLLLAIPSPTHLDSCHFAQYSDSFSQAFLSLTIC